jgi:hypothetical protein
METIPFVRRKIERNLQTGEWFDENVEKPVVRNNNEDD